MTLYAVYANGDMLCNSEPQAVNHTVMFNVTGGTCGTISFTQTSDERTVTLPTVTPTVAGWEFAGWSTTPVNETTTTHPTLLEAGSTYKPTANVTLYAVFTLTLVQDAGDGPAYRLVSSPTEGCEYVIVSSNAVGDAFAVDAANISTSDTAPPRTSTPARRRHMCRTAARRTRGSTSHI